MYAALVIALIMSVAAGAVTEDLDRRDGERDPMRPPPGSAGPAENVKEGEIYLPLQESSRTFSLQSLDRISHYRINVVAEGPFELRAQRSPSSFCSSGGCHQMPDFDIAFFTERGGSSASVVDRQYNVGPEQGIVPHNADFAHIYLRTPGVTPDNIHGYSFVYLQGDPGSSRVPDWP